MIHSETEYARIGSLSEGARAYVPGWSNPVIIAQTGGSHVGVVEITAFGSLGERTSLPADKLVEPLSETSA